MVVLRQDGMTALMIAAREGHATVIRALLTAGADVTLRNGVRVNLPLACVLSERSSSVRPWHCCVLSRRALPHLLSPWRMSGRVSSKRL